LAHYAASHERASFLFVAYYTQELYAQETVQHLSGYLHRIGMEHAIPVTLQPAQWERRKEQGSESC
jgi:hypothetical protein